MKRIVIAAACTLSLVGSASAQTFIVEDDYAAPVYEVAPVVPYYAGPVEVAPAPAYAVPVPAPRYEVPVGPRSPMTREVVVTEPEVTEPGVIYSAW